MSVIKKQRKDGKNVFLVRVQYAGKRVSKTVRTTETQAKRVEAEILKSLIDGTFDTGKKRQNPKFREYAEQYLEIVTWQKSYKLTVLLVKNLTKYFGDKKLTEVTSQDFLLYRSKRLGEVSHAFINREHSALLRMLNVAIKDDNFLINKNPLAGIKKLKEPPAEDRVLSIEEYRKLLNAAPEYFRNILFFACNTGMRKMEILNLTFGQIKMHINAAEIELINTKSGEKEYVPINEEVIKQLEEIARKRGLDLRNMSPADKKQYVFIGAKGQRLGSIRKPMERTFKIAGIELRPFHTFRHFWTKMMFEAGVDPYSIQKIGRWRDFETMLKYCYTTRPEEHEAVNKLASKLNEKNAEIITWHYSGNTKE